MRHSMLKIRSGAVPLIDVKMPQSPGTRAAIICTNTGRPNTARSYSVVFHGRHRLVKAASVVVNCALPLDDTCDAVEGLVVDGVGEWECDRGV